MASTVWYFYVGALFCNVFLSVLSSFAVILLRKRELIMFLLSFDCLLDYLFHMVPYPGHTHLYLSCYVSEGKDGKSKTPAPSVVLENLRLTLTDYRKRLDNTSDEVKIDSCKGICYAKLFEAAKIHVQIMRFACCLNMTFT